MSASMKAIRMHEYGGPEVLAFEEAPRPVPAADEVLVRVQNAGVNPFDWKVRQGHFRSSLAHVLPLIPGWDLSGVVEAVGPAVVEFAPGDPVYGMVAADRDGAYAEYVTARARHLAPKPSTLSHLAAAAVPTAALTAWQALFGVNGGSDSIGLGRSQTLLVHGGAGGVGSFAVQLARWRGARVLATASAAHVGFVRELGAHLVIDYQQERFEELVSGVDAVLDLVGGDTQARSFRVLAPGGVIASTVSPPPAAEARARRVRAVMVHAEPSALTLREIACLIDHRLLRVFVSQVFPLSQARQAHALSQSGHAQGKIVLDVAA
jgi:NADPH:quinone reductase-like Zn-dependent oxidoreductase